MGLALSDLGAIVIGDEPAAGLNAAHRSIPVSAPPGHRPTMSIFGARVMSPIASRAAQGPCTR
ncbi:MAG TPA: hypothetical protein VFX25_18990 [Streptosporangiaceae bacterium]|nr:hypothetical protein [Streptosporangiaceae bacterium]